MASNFSEWREEEGLKRRDRNEEKELRSIRDKKVFL